MTRLPVCVVTPSLHRTGGTERCLTEQVARWRDRFDLRLCTMEIGYDVDLDDVAVLTVPRLPGPHVMRFGWWFVANHLARWCNWRDGTAGEIVVSPGINCLDADAVGVHMLFAVHWERVRQQVVRDLLRPRRFPRTAHRIVYWWLIRVLERRIYRGPATVWAVSGEDARELTRRFERPPRSVRAIPHGVDVGAFSPEGVCDVQELVRANLGVQDSRVVLLLANDAYMKGVDVGVKSLRYLPADVVLAVAGKVDAAQVTDWADAAGVGDRVLVWPHVPYVERYYAAADLLIAPSREDAFNLPVLEALACGLPAVVSARAGVADLLDDGRHALLLHDPEDPGELARVVRRVFDDGGLREHLGQEGRALAESKSWDKNAERTADLIEREATTPRVLVLATDPLEAGGVGRASRTLLRALTELYGDERVGVLPVWGGDGKHDLPGWRLYPGWHGSGRVPVHRQITFALRAVRLARRWRRRLVVIAAHPHLAPVARLAAMVAGCRYAVWAHGYEVWGPVRRRIRAGLRGADTVWAVSEFTATQLREGKLAAADRISVLPHALPSELAAPLVADRPGADGHDSESTAMNSTVLTVARLTRPNAYKGVDTLLKAWPAVCERVPDAHLVVIGDGDDRGRLEVLANRLGVAGSVEFTGQATDGELAAAYGRAEVFALPGRARTGVNAGGEGFGLVFLEAAAAGLPVVAGRAGGAAEAVRDGQTGLLVDPYDPEAIAQAVVGLLEDRDRAAAMGEAGRRWVGEAFSLERFRARIDEEIRELAGLDGGDRL